MGEAVKWSSHWAALNYLAAYNVQTLQLDPSLLSYTVSYTDRQLQQIEQQS